MSFDYKKHHTRYFYNPKNGQKYACNSVDDEARAKDQGFTSATYVKSKWPTTLYHKQTGEARAVGNLEWSEEKNEAAVKALGPDWSDEPPAMPEPKRKKQLAASAENESPANLPMKMLEDIMAEVRAGRDEIADLEMKVAEGREEVQRLNAVVSEISAARMMMESRLEELERDPVDKPAPATQPPAAKDPADKPGKAGGK